MNVNEVLDLVRKAQLSPQAVDEIAKAFTAATGLVAYDLEAPAKKMVPALTPLRNMTPRVKSGAGDTATRWKAITAVNTLNVHGGVSEGNRGAVITDSVADKTAAYVGLGLENSVTFEADYSAESFDDAKARAVENLLLASILKEEDMLLGGNASVALGTTPTPTVAKAAGGSITAATYKVVCVALTYEGYRRSTVSATGIPGTNGVITRTNADSSTDTINVGAAQQSAESADVTTETTNLSITAYVTPVRGAVAYAWYLGLTGQTKIAAITTINSVKLTALPDAGNQAASAATTADKSKGSLNYDGFLYTGFNSDNNAYYKALATGTAGTGTVLTADGKGGVVEINDALGSFWDNLQLQPDAIWCNRQQANDISNRCVAAGTTAMPFRFNVNGGNPQGSLVGGARVSEYMSPVDSSIIPINIHPKMAPGTIMFTTRKLPYALNNVGDVFRVKCRRDWYQIEWPMRTRKYEYGVYADEVFQHYFPPSLGIITNVAAG